MTYTQIFSESTSDKRDKVTKSLSEIARHLYSIQGDLLVVIDYANYKLDGWVTFTEADAEYLSTLLQVTRKAHEKVCEMLGQLSS